MIRRAKTGEPISYGELAETLHKECGHRPQARKTLYGPPVGAVGQVIQELGKDWGEVIPPINTIVVDARKMLPSTGADEIAHYFFEDNGRGMKKGRVAYLKVAMDAVFAYGTRWDRVAEALGAPTLKPVVADQGDKIKLPRIAKTHGPESEEHKALKAWVSDNPKLLAKFGRFGKGTNEEPLSSGDRLDVYFESRSQKLAVEVKTSRASDDEILRGVYQCIKYRAVLRAMQQAQREVPNGDAILVSTRKPHAAAKIIMKRLHVNFVLAPSRAEHQTV